MAKAKKPKTTGTLYIVATPIGNLDEMTPRAAKILSEADLIAAEDTRSAGSLFTLLGLERAGKFVAYHKFNERESCAPLLAALAAGRDVVLVSDAGMPCISDPGAVLVRGAADAGINIVGIGGGSAVTLALAVSGFKAEPFLFLGFLPRKSGEMSELLRTLQGLPFPGGKASPSSTASSYTIVFYESPRRVFRALEFFAQNLPQVKLCICNDLTKKFERIYRGTAAEILQELQANPNAEKGEYTCVAELTPEAEESEEAAPESLLVDIMVKRRCSLKEAVSFLAHEKKHSKKKIYAASLELKKLL